MKLRLPAPAAFATGWGLFLVTVLAGRLAEAAGWAADAVSQQVVIKSAMAALAVAAMAWDGRGFADFGFRRPASGWWGRALGGGLALGAGTTLAVLVSPAQGMTFLRSFGFLQLVAVVWLGSSLAEEIFTRGLIQGWTRDTGDGRPLASAPVLTSGLLFGSMHLSLLTKQVDPWTIAIVVVGTTLLGLVAAVLRRRFDSLIPAIVAHVAFNVGGMAAGIAWVVAARLAG